LSVPVFPVMGAGTGICVPPLG